VSVLLPDPARTVTVGGLTEAGSWLNVDRLTRELHVSNTPARQVIARLARDDIVTHEPNRGFRASHLLYRKAIPERP
jgi:DNA-binding GntR family transcriptional regulator